MILTELVEKYEVFLVIFPHTALAGGGSKPPAICNQFHSLSIVCFVLSMAFSDTGVHSG